MAQWMILLLSFCGLLNAGEIQSHTLQECCYDGRDHAPVFQDCTIVPRISSSHLCRIVQMQCCAAVVENHSCDKGVKMAKMQGACERPFFQGSPSETKIAKDCCDCCTLGLATASQGSSCEHQGLLLGELCLHTAEACCNKNTTEETDPNTNATVTGKPEVSTTAKPHEGSDACRDSNCSQLCEGNGTCACRAGYQLQQDGRNCEDINECLMGSHNCVTGQVCINTDGSFRCQRETGCGTGYELKDDNTCQDIDECTLGLHNCGPDFLCSNTEGSFRCRPKETCSAGFIQDAVGSCIDVNECVAYTGPCPPGQTCVNTEGSYICVKNSVTCGPGYKLTEDGSRCEDVDECRTGDVCVGHGCVNLLGSYQCDCRIGFIFNSISSLCEDFDECRHYSGQLCAHKCTNTEGSYQCSCSTGFKLSHDGRNCDDINECDANPCSQECANIFGSYQCYCRRGYQLSDIDGISCEDIDECALSTGGRVCSYQCSNTPGSFYCTCPPTGYTLALNGRTCQDIDECAAGSHMCSYSESCVNIQGGFRCLSFACPQNFRQAAQGRCERVTCEFTRDPASCLSLPLRISFYNISFPTSAPIPADIFRMGPSNSVAGDTLHLDIVSGDEEGYFGVQQHAHGGEISLRRAVSRPRDFFLTVQMRLTRYGTPHLYMAKIAVSKRDSVNLRCVKSCQPEDVGCRRDPIHLITHTCISLPTFRYFNEPEEIIFLRTVAAANPAPLPGAIDVFFDILTADEQFSFDVQKHSHQGMIMGVVRQVKPIIGPRELVLEVAMNYFKSGVISHCNIVVIHVFISEFGF